MESSADERKLRAFIALKTPSEWDERLGELQHDLKPKLGGSTFRWVKPAQISLNGGCAVMILGRIRLSSPT